MNPSFRARVGALFYTRDAGGMDTGDVYKTYRTLRLLLHKILSNIGTAIAQHNLPSRRLAIGAKKSEQFLMHEHGSFCFLLVELCRKLDR